MSSPRLKPQTLYALGLILAALAVRAAIMLVTDNAVSSEQEAYSRINLMMQWQRNPGLYPQLEFAPLHNYWLAALYFAFGRSVPAVRIGTILLSGVGLWALYDAVRRLADHPTALLALALTGAAYIPSAVSTVALAEGPSLAFFALALNFFIRASAGRKTQWTWLIASAIALNAAGAFRFEAWAFVPLMALALWRRPKAAVAFALLGVIFPVFHMVVCWIKLGDPLHSLHVPSAVAQIQELNKPLAERLLGWPKALVASVGWGIAMLAAAGLVVSTLNRKTRLLPWLFAPILAVLVLRSARGSMAPDLLRYSTTLAALGCCIGACALQPLLSRRTGAEIVAVLIAAAVLALGGDHTIRSIIEQRNEVGLGPGPRQAASLLRSTAGPDDLLLTSQAYHGFLAVESGIDISRIRFPECGSVPASAPWQEQRDCLAEDMQNKLRDLPVAFLAVDYTDDVVQALIAANGGVIISGDEARLVPLVAAESFALYRVEKKHP